MLIFKLNIFELTLPTPSKLLLYKLTSLLFPFNKILMVCSFQETYTVKTLASSLKLNAGCSKVTVSGFTVHFGSKCFTVLFTDLYPFNDCISFILSINDTSNFIVLLS